MVRSMPTTGNGSPKLTQLQPRQYDQAEGLEFYRHFRPVLALLAPVDLIFGHLLLLVVQDTLQSYCPIPVHHPAQSSWPILEATSGHVGQFLLIFAHLWSFWSTGDCSSPSRPVSANEGDTWMKDEPVDETRVKTPRVCL